MKSFRNMSLFDAQACGRQIRYGAAVELGREIRPGSGERRLGVFVLPPFQRPPVWSQDQKVRLIESLWLGLPIAAYVFNECADCPETDMWLIDGQQRWTAILGYLADEFSVFGLRFSELSPVDRLSFHNKQFGCIQTKISDAALLRDIYERLAYGGTAH